MNNEQKKQIESAVLQLVNRAARMSDAAEAMRFTQAACNLVPLLNMRFEETD